MRKLLVALFGLLIMSAPAGAQDKPVSINIGAGVLMPLSGLNDVFDTGWNGGIGATFNVSPTFGLQAEYMYNWMPGPEKTILVSPDAGRSNLGPVDREQSQDSFGDVQWHPLVSENREGWRIRHRWHRLLSSDSTADVTRRRVRHGLRPVLVLVLSGGGGG